MQLGSCISTLVSSTYRRRSPMDFLARAAVLSKRFDGIQHLLCMSFDADLAPLAAQHALGIDQEGAAFDAHEFSAIKALLLDDVKQPADFFVFIAQQVEFQAVLLPEAVVGLQAVAGYADDQRVGSLEFRLVSAEILGFQRTTRGVVLGVEVQHHVMPLQLRKSEAFAAGGGQFETRRSEERRVGK